jgi:hypothetical protein
MDALAASFAGFGSLAVPLTVADAEMDPLLGAVPATRTVTVEPAARPAKLQPTVAPVSEQRESFTDSPVGWPPS